MGLYDLTIGLMLIGVFINTYLFGIVTYQYIAYYNSGCKDPLWLRGLVAFMALIDTAHSILLMYMAWWYCVTNYANPDSLLAGFWVYSFTVIANAITTISTQLFLGYRIYGLTRNKLIFGVICIMAVVIFVIGMMGGIWTWTINVSKLAFLYTSTTCWLGLQAGLDLFITGIMVFCLYRSRTRFQQMNRVLTRLIGATIQTGTFCTIFALAGLISYRIMPDTNIFAIFGLPTGRIYSITLVSTLNMRDALREILSEPRITNFRISTSQSQSQLPSQLKEPHDGPGLNVSVLHASTETGNSHSSLMPQNRIGLMPSGLSFSSEGGRIKDRAFELVEVV